MSRLVAKGGIASPPTTFGILCSCRRSSEAFHAFVSDGGLSLPGNQVVEIGLQLPYGWEQPARLHTQLGGDDHDLVVFDRTDLHFELCDGNAVKRMQPRQLEAGGELFLGQALRDPLGADLGANTVTEASRHSRSLLGALDGGAKSEIIGSPRGTSPWGTVLLNAV